MALWTDKSRADRALSSASLASARIAKKNGSFPSPFERVNLVVISPDKSLKPSPKT